LRFDPEQRRQLLLLFKEALHNVVRHSRCAAAGVRIDVRDGRLVAEIRDDGRGFAVGAAPSGTGHGLDSMRARAARLGGKLRIQSEVGAGTRLLLEVPAHRRHA
jgi:signal transduction histidine kinase